MSDANASPGETQDVTSGNAVEKIAAPSSIPWNGAGSSGRESWKATSTVSEMFASTSTRGPRFARPLVILSVMFVEFAYGALGNVTLLPVWLPQFPATLVDSRASRRGKFIDTVTSAFNLSVNSKPIGIEGLKARPRRISTFVTLTLNGRGVSVDPGKPFTPLLLRSVSSIRMLELLGTWSC